MEYIAYLQKDKKSDYGVSFPDFPGCVTAGSTLEEARRMAVEALSVHIAGMVEDGDAIPEPSTLDSLHNDPDMKGACRAQYGRQAYSGRKTVSHIMCVVVENGHSRHRE